MGKEGVGRRRHSGRNCGGEVRGPSGAPGAAIGGHLGPQWTERARSPVEGQLGFSREKLSIGVGSGGLGGLELQFFPQLMDKHQPPTEKMPRPWSQQARQLTPTREEQCAH